MTLFDHFSECPSTSPENWHWQNFKPAELSCPCCGEYYHDERALNTIQRLRDKTGRPIVINSAHRCGIRNALVGGAPMSQHKLIAFDVSTRNYDRHEIFRLARESGFTSFGFYKTFLHMDLRPGRRWYSKGAKQLWNG